MEAFPSNTGLDSKMDIDVSKPAEPHKLSLTQDVGSIPTLDGWIENLMNCKQLSENDVSRLCDRVGQSKQKQTGHTIDIFRRAKFSKKNPMSNQWYVKCGITARTNG
jgi:hypothetical protein